MLLIAQPRSAGTSLITTLSDISGKKGYYDIDRKKNIGCNEFLEIQKYHVSIFDMQEKLLSNIVKINKSIWRLHVLPTKEHLEILEKLKPYKIIILLRYPEDSLDSYRRFFEKNKNNFVNYDELLNDLRLFHDRYVWWKSLQPHCKIVYYRDLILRYNETMKSILKWYGLKYKKIIPLAKKKYTEIGEKRVKACYI